MSFSTRKTGKIVNTLCSRALAGEKIFYNIYSEAEIAADHAAGSQSGAPAKP